MSVVPEQTSDELSAALKAVTIDPPDDPGPISVRARRSFDSQSAGPVRRDHAVKAVESPDDLVFFGYQDIDMFVASKATEPPGKPPFVLLAFGGDRDGARQVTSGYRLYPDAGEDAMTLARDARRAFRIFLERYALPYKAGDRWVLFVPIVVQHPDENGDTTVLQIDPSAKVPDYVLNAQMKTDGQGTVTVAWPFAINITAYKRDVKRHQN